MWRVGYLSYECEEFDQWRDAMHTPEIPTNPRLLDERTYRLDEGEDTITVDHIRASDMWARSQGFLSHAETTRRGAGIDAREVQRVAAAVAHFEPDFDAYCPTTGDLDSLPKYSRRGFQCWRGEDKDRSREGLLPAFLKLKYDGALPEKNLRQIEWEQLQADRRIDARLNSTRGWTR